MSARTAPSITDGAELDCRAPINQRYRIVRTLGRGGMGTVYLVNDLRDAGRPLALKCIRKDRLDSRTLAILRNEFLTLSALRHPNLARAHEFGMDRDTSEYFFTSEFVDGVSWLKASQGMDLRVRSQLEDFLEVLAQVLRGLEFIHSRGTVHGDIKPENVLVRREVVRKGAGSGTLLIAKIIDFGLAKKERAIGGKKILGTPYYVAPETILGSSIDRRADLYSLGILLYHVLTGRPPFRGESNLAILKGHVEETAAPPHEVDPRVPAPLGAFILRLMEKRPADRIQGALQALEHLRGAFNLSLPLETPETRASYLEAAVLAARESEISRVRAVFLAASGRSPADVEVLDDVQLALHGEEGHPSLHAEEEVAPPGRMLVLRGEKGLGKRRIAEELRFFAQSQGARFLSIECSQEDAGTSGGSRLAAELGSLDLATADALRIATLGPSPSFSAIHPLARQFTPLPPPEGEALRGRPEGAAPEPRRKTRSRGESSVLDLRRARLREAAGAVLRSTQRSSLVLHFHDMHLASEDFLELVRNLVHLSVQGKDRDNRLLVTATALDRSDVEGTPFQEALDNALFHGNVLELEVERLDERGVTRFIRSAFPGSAFPDAFQQRVLEESDGNLETVVQILRFLLDREKIARTPSGWVLGPDYDREDVPGKVRRELKARIAQLPQDVLLLAKAFACLGDACEIAVASRLAGLSGRSVPKALDVLRKEKILQARAQANRSDAYSFVHSSARAFLYHLIPESDLAAIHEKAGELREEENRALGRHDPKELARHYLRAGNRLKGVQYGLEAARELASELLPLDAIRIYEQVLSLASPEDSDLIKKVSREIASLRFHAGDYKGVIDSLGPLPAIAGVRGDGKWEASAYLEASRARARLGHFEEAAGLLDGALALAKRQPGPAQAPVILALGELHFLKGAHIESLRHASRVFEMRGELKDPMLLCDLYMLLAENHFALNDRDRAASHCQLALRILDAQHDTSHLASSLFCRGKLYLYKSQFSKASKQFQLCLILRRKMSAFDGQADCLLELGSIQHLLGAAEEARPLLEEALSLYEKSGNLSRWVMTLSLFGEVLRLTGDLPGCHRAVAEALRRMGALESRRIHVQTLLTFAGLCMDRGDLRKADRYLHQAQEEESRGAGTGGGTVRALSLFAEHAYQAGNLGFALECATQGVAAAREMGDPSLLARLMAQQSFLHCHLGKAGEARRALVNLLDLSRRHELPTSEGWARLLEGMVLTAEGKLEGAEKLLCQAMEIFGSHASERDLVQLYLEHGLLHLKRERHEEAYLSFEEGLELARKLRLGHLQARFHVAIALLEMALAEGDSPRAEEELEAADAIASKPPYPEILWQVHFQMGRLLTRAGRGGEAETFLRTAFEDLKKVLPGIPGSCRELYLRSTGAGELAHLLERSLKQGCGSG